MRLANFEQPLRGVHRRHKWLRLMVPFVFILVAAPPASAQLTGPQETPGLQTREAPEWAITAAPTADGDYSSAAAVVFPNVPSMPAALMRAGPLISYFGGNWIDVDLSLPATMTAYQGDVPVRTMYTIIGRGPLSTPTGTFSIIRRVANETMDSSTIGIPRNGPGGYYLPNVLFTQYFLPSGESIHYNYWSANFGYPGSHGCLGLSYDDAAFMWDFADIGTVVSIHY